MKLLRKLQVELSPTVRMSGTTRIIVSLVGNLQNPITLHLPRLHPGWGSKSKIIEPAMSKKNCFPRRWLDLLRRSLWASNPLIWILQRYAQWLKWRILFSDWNPASTKIGFKLIVLHWNSSCFQKFFFGSLKLKITLVYEIIVDFFGFTPWKSNILKPTGIHVSHDQIADLSPKHFRKQSHRWYHAGSEYWFLGFGGLI